MLLGLLLGIVGTSLVFAAILGLCLAASRRDDFENSDELTVAEELHLLDDLRNGEWPDDWLPPWVNGTDAA